LPLQGIDFGVSVAEKSMIAMRTLSSSDEAAAATTNTTEDFKPSVMLNLTRKELDVQFSINIDNEPSTLAYLPNHQQHHGSIGLDHSFRLSTTTLHADERGRMPWGWDKAHQLL
jgi:hypothetical protein